MVVVAVVAMEVVLLVVLGVDQVLHQVLRYGEKGEGISEFYYRNFKF